MRRHVILALLVAVVPILAVALIVAVMAQTGMRKHSGDFRVDDLPGPVVAFYGDSFALGAGASQEWLRWSTLLSEQREWNEYNPSVNGLGFVARRELLGTLDVVDQIVYESPDVVICALGYNDLALLPGRADDVRTAISEDFDRLAAIPGVHVVVMAPPRPAGGSVADFDQLVGWMQEAALSHSFDFLADGFTVLDGHPEWLASDGVHPNDDGHRAIAEAVNDSLVLPRSVPAR